MVSFKLVLVPVLAAVSVLGNNNKCLDYHEANGFAKRWLSIWSSGTITKRSQLESLVTKDVMSYDGTYGQATTGIDALFASCTAVDPLVKNVVQAPEWVFNNCDQIAARWSYNAISTGVATGNGPTVKAGTHIFFEGIELLRVDLGSRLISNSTSSADWVLLAQQLGETVVL